MRMQFSLKQTQLPTVVLPMPLIKTSSRIWWISIIFPSSGYREMLGHHTDCLTWKNRLPLLLMPSIKVTTIYYGLLTWSIITFPSRYELLKWALGELIKFMSAILSLCKAIKYWLFICDINEVLNSSFVIVGYLFGQVKFASVCAIVLNRWSWPSI